MVCNVGSLLLTPESEPLCRFFKKKIGYIPENDVSNVFDRPDFEVLYSYERCVVTNLKF